MASYHCEKCGRVFELTDDKGGVCPVCATPVSVEQGVGRPRQVTDPARQAEIYDKALTLKNNASTFGEWEKAGKLFASISGYKDADAQAAACHTQADEANREAVYLQAKHRQGGTIEALRGKAEMMRRIAGYRDADELADAYQREADALAEEAARSQKVKEEKNEAATQEVRRRDRRHRKVGIICTIIGAAVLAVVLVISLVIVPAKQYSEAIEKFNAGEYAAASEQFASIAYYKDSTEYLQKAYYHLGKEAMGREDYLVAENYWDKAGDTEDAPVLLAQVRGILYDRALTELAAGEYAAAQADFDAVGNFEEAKKYEHFCRALRVWNGDKTVDAEKLDLLKAEDIIWQVMDGLWYSEDSGQEIWIEKSARESETPPLTITGNVLEWSADGVTYKVEILSQMSFVLISDNGEYNGRYDKA